MNTRTRTQTAAAAGSLLIVGFAGLAGLASAAPAAAAPVSVALSSIRAAHLSPDVPGVDIYLTAFSGMKTQLWTSDETYGEVSPYATVKPGLYTVAMRPHGAAMSTPPMLSWTLNAEAGRAYTAAAIGTGSSHKGTVLDDDLTTPRAGTGRVRLIQAASTAPTATVTALHGPIVADDTPFASSTGYAQIPAGSWPLTASDSTDAALRTSGTVSIASASVTSILLLDRPGGGLRLETVLDAAGAATMPQGAVPAGGGGTAGIVINRDGPSLRPLEIVAGATTVLIVGLACARRRRRTTSDVPGH